MIVVVLNTLGRRPVPPATSPAQMLGNLPGMPALSPDPISAAAAAAAATTDAPTEVRIAEGTSFSMENGILYVNGADDARVAVFSQGSWLYAYPEEESADV